MGGPTTTWIIDDHYKDEKPYPRLSDTHIQEQQQKKGMEEMLARMTWNLHNASLYNESRATSCEKKIGKKNCEGQINKESSCVFF